MKIHFPKAAGSWKGEAGSAAAGLRPSTYNLQPARRGIALIITLIMLAVTLVMAVAFLALARRERGSVSTTTDTTTARLAAETAVANAQAQIVAGIFAGLTNGVSGNAYNLHLLVSTNYINAAGFNPNGGPNGFGPANPTNVNYFDANGNLLTGGYLEQNVANLWFQPRAPVMIGSNEPVGRFYLDLNENGRFDSSGLVPQIGPNGGYLHPDGTEDNNPVNVLTNMAPGGDPEWVGVLEHPDAPHSANNHFVSRYAFVAVPEGNGLDINYIHNEARNGTATTGTGDGFMRNQGVGSWEINLAAFLADLNTNVNMWGAVVGSGASAPLGSDLYYQYNQPERQNYGHAFDDARALLAYRYNYTTLPSADAALNNFGNRVDNVFPGDNIDGYSDGPLQTTLNTNADLNTAFLDGDPRPSRPWSGADSTNHYFAPGDFFDATKVSGGPTGGFTNRLRYASGLPDTYDRYTYYRMLNQLGTDSSSDDGKVNLNYSNAVVTYFQNNGAHVVKSISVVPGAETNLVPWRPLDFFHAAADKLLRLYTTNWFQSNPSNYLVTYYGTNYYYYHPGIAPDPSGYGLTNCPYFGMTNQIPAFGVTGIPVFVNSNFVYSPAINRLLQLAANVYDATTNGNFNLPHVFRPIFEHDEFGNVFIVSYTEVTNIASGIDSQLAPPYDVSTLPTLFKPASTPIILSGGFYGIGPVNVYGVPWIIGAKKGLPSFNQLYMINAAQVTRKLEVTRTSTDPATARYTTNQMYVIGISNSLGVSFWNSYYTNYPRRVRVYVSDFVNMGLTNDVNSWSGYTNLVYGRIIYPSWPGSQWSGTAPNATPSANSFYNVGWSFNFLNPSVYRFNTHSFDPGSSFTSSEWETPPTLAQLPPIGLAFTNYLQAFILDGPNVIDYVQLRGPVSVGNLNQALADETYAGPYPPTDTKDLYGQWFTNDASGTMPPRGVVNQIAISRNYKLDRYLPGDQQNWSIAPTPMGTTPPAESAYFDAFFNPNAQYNGQPVVNDQLSIQAPYTPTRTVYSSYLLQANDPLVHYLASDLNAGGTATWANQSAVNGLWYHSDDPATQPLPSPPAMPIHGRYQPWGAKGQMASVTGADANLYNLSYKDPLVWGPDSWDFPTNLYPSVGWIGRVHRGTPWQTIYLKSTNILFLASTVNPLGGLTTWANWSGDLTANSFDAWNSAPWQDWLLFDAFTARFNDNAARGALPVNVGAGLADGGLAAWSALFSGMVALSNSAANVFPGYALTYNNLIINPAGVVNPALANGLQPPLWQIVNGTNGINATRTNRILFPSQSFTHVGQILATPALSTYSPFLNNGSQTERGKQQWAYGINDELYEWLPQHLMGLVRQSEPRYVIYAYGQTLKPAPDGTVLSGPYFQLVTNYQVVAESAVRAVIRVDAHATAAGTNYSTVVESYNVLPPN